MQNNTLSIHRIEFLLKTKQNDVGQLSQCAKSVILPFHPTMSTSRLLSWRPTVLMFQFSRSMILCETSSIATYEHYQKVSQEILSTSYF